MAKDDRVVFLIPCLNEEATIFGVVRDILDKFSYAEVLVGDNGSTDKTASEATRAGAKVISLKTRGKGLMMRRLFENAEAACYVMVDGDATYSISNAQMLIDEVLEGKVDMVIGSRSAISTESYRPGHSLGNKILSSCFSMVTKTQINDCLSGYRVMSHRFVKTFVGRSTGFEIEVELNAHAAILGCSLSQIQVPYFERPSNSVSKLNTYRDGVKILRRILNLFKQFRPMQTFSIVASPWLIASMIYLASFQISYVNHSTVKTGSIVAGTFCGLVGLNLLTVGLILKTLMLHRQEQIRLVFIGTGKIYDK